MKYVIQDAAVVLTGADRPPGPARTGQALSIFRSSDAVIGIDGHTGFVDPIVEVCWQGLHGKELEGIRQVEIRDGSGRPLEVLPLDPTRACREKDGDTYFYLNENL
jgi:hypothetical protein